MILCEEGGKDVPVSQLLVEWRLVVKLREVWSNSSPREPGKSGGSERLCQSWGCENTHRVGVEMKAEEIRSMLKQSEEIQTWGTLKTLRLTQAQCFHSLFSNTVECMYVWLLLVELLWQMLPRSLRNLASGARANTFSLRSPSSCCLFFCLAALLAEGTTALWMCEASLRTDSCLQLLSCCLGLEQNIGDMWSCPHHLQWIGWW